MSVAGEDRLADVRRSYEHGSLALADLADAERADPVLVVRRWLAEAVTDGRDLEPTAMVLATVREGELGVDARVVLCKEVDEGVVFYTNGASAKGRQLAAAPAAAVVFHWRPLERQVRCRGTVTPVAAAESDEYFATRPRQSRLGAWVSDQSRPIADRDELEQRLAAVERRFEGQDVPRPPAWGGYRLVPDELELWQGRPGRLHDRLLATRTRDGWHWQRLQP